MASFDVFVVANSVLIDDHIYDLWLVGHNVQETCRELIRGGILSEMEGADEDCVISEVNDHFRFFALIERYLENPKRLKEQCHLQLSADVTDMLVEKYYGVDDIVIRELLGKKLSAKARKDLDDIADKTKVALKSCRRQFDNFRRIFKTVEDMKGSLVSNIMQHYLLSERLARKYAAAVFITNNRFETGKKRLAYLSLNDFVACSNQMITHWSYSSSESRQDNMDVDVDREFLHDLKDLKALLEKEVIDDVKNELIRKLEGQLADRAKNELESNFKTLYKVIVGIAVDLNHSRDLRDFFVVLVEKFVEPCKHARWTKGDLEKVLGMLNEALKSHEILRNVRRTVSAQTRWSDKGPERQPQSQLALTWDRYFRVVAACILRIYRI